MVLKELASDCWSQLALSQGFHPRARAIRNRTLTLIEREDDTRSWGNFSGLFLTLHHNAMPSKGLRIHTYRLLASQEYARC
jgi:hypothetical protein